MNAFQTCLQQPEDEFPRVGAGRTLGESLGVKGTPTVWVNGEPFQGRAVEAFLEKAQELGLTW